MEKLLIIIDMDNDSFQDNPELEISAILKTVQDIVKGYAYNSIWVKALRDSKGNVVGKVEYINHSDNN